MRDHNGEIKCMCCVYQHGDDARTFAGAVRILHKHLNEHQSSDWRIAVESSDWDRARHIALKADAIGQHGWKAISAKQWAIELYFAVCVINQRLTSAAALRPQGARDLPVAEGNTHGAGPG